MAEPAPAELPPLDPNVDDSADADTERRIRFLRARLAAEPRPSRQALLRLELLKAQGVRTRVMSAEEPGEGATFTMTYTARGETRTFALPAERLWEVIERADREFCRPPTAEDLLRFERALAIGKSRT